jgi:PKD repeat protein
MMKKQLMFILGTTLALNAFSQDKEPTMIPCGTYEAMEAGFKADPNLKVKYNLIQSQLEQEYLAAIKNKASQKTSALPIYTVPIVFHIMGTGHSGSVTDQVFTNLITYLNNDYAKTGNDIAQINPTFGGLYVDSEIRFALAQRDPNGNCTNGIIRHDAESKYWSQNSPNYKFSGTGTNRWPVNKYMNIYIVDCITSPSSTCPQTGSYVAGYTYKPGSTPYTANANQGDAIVLLSFNGALAQFNSNASRTISHEIGHWLNLSHTFGNTNSPEVACGNDGIGDTPNTKGYFTVNRCPSHGQGSFTGCSPTENDENIMDYGSCPKMFTQGQVTAMRSALESAVGGRSNLWSNANLLATGIAGGYTCAPVADFDANKKSVCAGNPITFTNESFVGTSGNVAWTFEGGSPATSTTNAPVVTYATPGTYSVSLVATNPSGNNTKNQTSYITVVQGGSGIILPNAFDFESGTSLPNGMSVTNNNAGSVAWAITTSNGGNNTAQSMFLNNASQASSAGHIDMFETPVYNFANTNNVSLSYYYAYAKKVTAQIDSFRVQYSLDCGGNWSNIGSIPSIHVMAASSGSVQASAFTPTAAQWKQVSVSPVLLSALNNKPSVKFRFWFKSDAAQGSSNNIYIDQINLSGTVGLNELESSLDMMIYPNPTNASATIDFNNLTASKMKVSVMDIVGRVVEESDNFNMNGNRASYTVNKNGTLAKGIYVINMYSGDQKISKKLIIE